MKVSTSDFGKTPDGNDALLWTIENSLGTRISLTNWGATIASVATPDSRGHVDEITLGFNDASAYTSENGYMGATIGRCADIISGGRLVLDGKTRNLLINRGKNHLHGGERGFNRYLWGAEPFTEADAAGVLFTLVSEDGDEGYPGRLTVRASYGLSEGNRLMMLFEAETDALTVVNITNHSYWNLAGAGSGTILDHEIMWNASRYLPLDSDDIPLGTRPEVESTPYDFRSPRKIGAAIDSLTGGYDNSMVIDGVPGILRTAAVLKDPGSGRILRLSTDRPVVQFFTAENLDGAVGAGGRKHEYRGAVCLEPQDYPDAPNQPNFPSTELQPGDTYKHLSVIDFSVDRPSG